ncbi:DUF937 domain-containing protein [Salaquimonas pukyongi]|uniref:DUF937 domain-containing protein n=1 Tax=Salaquimonas pukyongi TaxID=2712698 RepID=UPI00096B8D2C|nr:DUF937 domain-containing protein [Salaquimonas pukyongi]
MNPLFDMLNQMQKAQGQASLAEQMSGQFGIQQQQAQQAIEALMPAFAQGLRRNVSSPQGFAGFMQALATGNHTRYTQNPAEAFSQSGLEEGNAILGHLFGGKEVSRAVARQAEAASGLSQSILKQMLPALAPLIMGGLTQQMTGAQQSRMQASSQPANAFGGGGILGQILEQMMRNGMLGGKTGGGAQPRSPGGRNPLEEILEQMTGRRSPDGGRGAPSGNSGDNLGDIFNDMLKQGPGGRSPYREAGDSDPYEAPQTGPEAGHEHDEPATQDSRQRQGYPEGTGLEDLFGDLFKPPSGSSPKYEKDIESIFDEFLPRK